MTPQMGFSETGRIPIKLITLIGCLLAIAVLFSAVGRASANPAPASDPDLLQQRAPAPGQVAPEQDATLNSLSVTVSGEPVALAPQFDPATTLYTATVDAETVNVIAEVARTGAVIDRFSVGDNTVDLDTLVSLLTFPADLAEGTATVVSLRVRAADRVTTETYYVILSRPADPSVPDLTIEATPAEYVAGIGTLSFTVTRDGPRQDAPVATVNFTQDEDWLSDTTRTFAFAVGGEIITEPIPSTAFSSSVIRSGNLVATVAPVAGYDTSGAAQVRIISQEGPAVTVRLDSPTYTVAEGAGTLDVALVARAHSSVPRIDGFNVGVLTDGQTASSDEDSRDFSNVSFNAQFNPSDFQMEGDVLIGRKTVTITIVDDDTYEGDETFHIYLTRPPGLSSEVNILDPKEMECTDTCPNPYVVTITDNDAPPVAVTIEHPAYTVVEDVGTLDVVLVARARPGITSVDAFSVAISSEAQTALSDPEAPDFQPVSELPRFTSTDFQVENGALVGRKTVSVTILEDDAIEGDELFHLHLGRSASLASEVVLLDPKGKECDTTCPNPYVVTITDNDPAVTVRFAQNAYTVVEGGSQGVTVMLSDDPQRSVAIPIVAVGQDGATGDDYSGVPESVTFDRGETIEIIPFVATDDTIDDDGESVKLSFGSMLPPGVAQGPISEAVVTITQRELTADMGRPGISIPTCESNGIFIFWQAAVEFESDPPPYGWRVERRHFGGGEWITDQFDFLGSESVALHTYSDEYWDWTDCTRRLEVDYTYRVHALNDGGDLLEGRNWSRRAPVRCQ